MLRSLVVLAIIAIGIRYSFKGAFYTLLFYLWLAYFRPDYWLWTDFVSPLRLSFVVGVVLLISAAFSKERLRLGFGPLLFLAFFGHTLVSTILSVRVEYSMPYWQEFAKTIVVCYLMIVLITTEERLRLVLLVIALSLGFEGAKQGWAELIRRPGAVNTNEWPMLGDNNGVAMGMLMLVPLWIALASTANRVWERRTGYFFAAGVAYRAISTYSRGGFLAALALGAFYLTYTKRKAVALSIAALAAIALTFVLPSQFWERMGTIRTAAERADGIDESAAGRWHFWGVATWMANDNPFFGVGHNAYHVAYDRYDDSDGRFGRARAVHSSWFGILAEQGYLGFALFAAILARAFFVCLHARRALRSCANPGNLPAYADAIQAGLIVATIGGSFISVHYTELLWHTMALAMVIELLVSERIAAASNNGPSHQQRTGIELHRRGQLASRRAE